MKKSRKEGCERVGEKKSDNVKVKECVKKGVRVQRVQRESV